MEIQVPSVEQLQTSLINRLKKIDWWIHLRMFLNGNDLTLILQTLLQDYAYGYRLTPKLSLIFRCFEECPFEQTKVIIFTSELSQYTLHADGIAYSCSLIGRSNNAQKALFREITETIDSDYKGSVDLSAWSQQGVLLLSNALTTIIGQKDAHLELWKPFMNTLFDTFKHELPDAVYVFVGESVHHWADRLHPDSVVFKVGLPTANFPNSWNSNIFNLTNEQLILKQKKPITW